MLRQWTGECEPDGLANGVRIEDASVRGTERIEEKVMSGPRIVFCSNNHIYDASLYDACPYCSKIEAEQKELVSQAALEMPDHAAAKGPEGFADENSLSGNFAGQPGSGSGREPADFLGKESMPEDPYGVTVIGTGPAPAGHGDPFGAEAPDQNVSVAGNLNNSAGNSGSYDKTVSSTGGLSGSEKKSPGTISDSSAEIDGMEDAVSGSPLVGGHAEEKELTGSTGYPSEKALQNEPETVSSDGAADAEHPSFSSRTAGSDHAGSDAVFEQEDEWDDYPMKYEGAVRGWFVLQNGIQKDHSIELCKKSMFIYDYDGMLLVISRQMEDMKLLATIEQYKTISILPEPGVYFEVDGEARRSCGKLKPYMRLLIGSHRMVYVPIDERLLNGER